MVAATEAVAALAEVLALWQGEAAGRTVTKVEAATEAVAATATMVAEAVAAQQQQQCHGYGGGGRHGGRSDVLSVSLTSSHNPFRSLAK